MNWNWMNKTALLVAYSPPKQPPNNQLARDPKSCVQLEVVGATTSPFVVASIANLFGRVKLWR